MQRLESLKEVKIVCLVKVSISVDLMAHRKATLFFCFSITSLKSVVE